MVNVDRSAPWPRYRRLHDGTAEALIALTLAPGVVTRVLREDGAEPVVVDPVGPAELRSMLGAADDDGAALPDEPIGIARMPVPASATVTYRIQHGDALATADPANDDGAGELASLLTHPDAVRDGVAGLDMWPPRRLADPTRTQRLSIDRGVLGRRMVARLSTPDDVEDRTCVPVIVLLDGDDWLHVHDAIAAFGAARSAGHIGPHAVVFVPAPSDQGARGSELTGDRIGPAVAGAVLDAVEDALADTGLRRGVTVVAGQSYGGVAAMRAAACDPRRRIDAVVAASPSFWWPAPETGDPLSGPAGGAVLGEIADMPTDVTFRFRVGDDEPAMRPHADAVCAALADAGADALCRGVAGAHDHSVWRGPLLADVCEAVRVVSAQSAG